MIKDHASFKYDLLKKSFDIVFSASLLIPITISITIVALLVVLVDKQNPFFIQKRTVNYNEVFDIYKIKTMKNGAITKLGKLLRQLSLDELPQIYNVLNGDMSRVGPRPLIIVSHEGGGRTTKSKAGITGLLQIEPDHKSASLEKIKIYDRLYDIKKSFSLDLYIILSTISSILHHKNRDLK